MALPKTYGVLIFEGIFSVDMTGPLAYFNSIPGTDVFFIHDTLLPVPSHVPRISHPPSRPGLSYIPTYTLDNAPPLDVLIVVGGGEELLRASKKWEEFVAKVYPSLQYLFAVCTGVAVLARSGVLDGKNATTNKESFAKVASQGPDVKWVKVGRWVIDGNIWTSSGGEAGTDMAYAFVSSVYGDDVARSISNHIEHTPNSDSAFDPFAALYDLPKPRTILDSTDQGTAPITHFGVLVFPGFVGFDAFSVLAYVEATLEITTFPLNVSLIAPTLEPVSTAGFTIENSFGQSYIPSHTLANPPPHLEVLIVPGLPTATPFPHQDELVTFIKAAYPNVRHIISVGTGSALLGEAGILDGRSATTAKALFEPVTQSIGSAGGNITWTIGRWVRDGNIWTASGAASGLDAAHALFTEMYGEAVTTKAAVILEYQPNTRSTDDPFAPP